MTTLTLFASAACLIVALFALILADEARSRAEKAEETAEQAATTAASTADELDLFETELDLTRASNARDWNDLRIRLSTMEGRQAIEDFIAPVPDREVA